MGPLVSVYIPTKNRLSLLKRAVRSVVKQTYRNLELIIVDDGSDRSIQGEFDDVVLNGIDCKIIRNDVSIGAAKSRNLALKCSKGFYVTGLDDDDYFDPKRVEILISKYKSKYSCVASNYYEVHKGNKQIIKYILPKVVTINDMMWENVLATQVMVERERIMAIKGYDESLLASQDYDLIIRLVEKYGPAKRLSSALYYMDVSHEKERISQSESRKKGACQIVDKYKDKMSLTQREYRKYVYGMDYNFNTKFEQQLYGLYGFGIECGVRRLRRFLRLG